MKWFEGPRATVQMNPDKDGVELVFASKPARSVLDALKMNGWRWSRFSSCWYKRDSATTRRYAEGIAGLEEGALTGGKANEDTGHAPDTDLLYEDQCQAATGA